MPTIRVYDERLPQVQTPSTPQCVATGTGGNKSVGFSSFTGSLFRTYDSNGDYKDFDTVLDGYLKAFAPG